MPRYDGEVSVAEVGFTCSLCILNCTVGNPAKGSGGRRDQRRKRSLRALVADLQEILHALPIISPVDLICYRCMLSFLRIIHLPPHASEEIEREIQVADRNRIKERVGEESLQRIGSIGRRGRIRQS